MFKWLKRLLVADEESTATEEDEPSFTDTLQLVTVWGVVERFLDSNPTPTPYSVNATGTDVSAAVKQSLQQIARASLLLA